VNGDESKLSVSVEISVHDKYLFFVEGGDNMPSPTPAVPPAAVATGTSATATSTGGGDVNEQDVPNRGDASRDTTSSDAVEAERSNILERTPGFRFISHPEFAMSMSTNEVSSQTRNVCFDL